MLAHGFTRAGRVPSGDRFDDPSVHRHYAIKQFLLGADQGAHLKHHLLNGVEQQDEERVVRRFAQTPVKLRVLERNFRRIA
jgi:hypothetical protein